MMPIDSKVREAMSAVGGIGLASELKTSLFKAWIGLQCRLWRSH